MNYVISILYNQPRLIDCCSTFSKQAPIHLLLSQILFIKWRNQLTVSGHFRKKQPRKAKLYGKYLLMMEFITVRHFILFYSQNPVKLLHMLVSITRSILETWTNTSIKGRDNTYYEEIIFKSSYLEETDLMMKS